MIDVFLFEKAIDRIGQPSPKSIAFVRHFHINGLERLWEVLADLLEIRFDAKIPQGPGFPVEECHPNGFLGCFRIGGFHC